MNLEPLIDRLAALPATEFPFLSLYLDTRPDQTGRDKFRAFVRKELHARAKTYPPRSPQRESFDRDIARIEAWLDAEARPAANGIAIFACAGAGDFFEAVQLQAPLDASALVVDRRPHVYPLARLADRYRRYAAVVADRHSARIFVFGLGALEGADAIENATPVPRTEKGGWSQARYQRHVDNYTLHHIKEMVDLLDRVVRTEAIDRVVFGGDEEILALIRAHLPKPLAEKTLDAVSLDIRSHEQEVFAKTAAVVRAQDAREDADLARRVLDAYRAGGLGVVGARETRAALDNGQVHELVLSADASRVRDERGDGGQALADELVTLARRTAARVTFVDDPALLDEVGGVGALLRYRVADDSATGRAA